MDSEDAAEAYTEATIAYGSARQLIDQLDRVIGAAQPWPEAVRHLEAARRLLLQAQADAFDAKIKAGEMLAQSA